MAQVSRIETNPFAKGIKPIKISNRDLPRSAPADSYSPPAGRCELSPPKKKTCGCRCKHTAKKKAKKTKRSRTSSRAGRTRRGSSRRTERSSSKKTNRSSSRAFTQSRRTQKSSSISTGQRYTCRPPAPRRPAPCREREGYWEVVEIVEIIEIEVVEIVQHGGIACYPPLRPPMAFLCPPPVVYDPCPPVMVAPRWSPPPMVVEFIPAPPPIVVCPPTLIIVEDGGLGCFAI